MALIAHYKLDEASGITAFDSVGSVDGTISGGVTLDQAGSPASPDGKSMLFNGTTGYIETVSNPNPFERTDSFSLACWVNTNGTASANETLINAFDELAPFRGYRLSLVSGKITFSLISTAGSSELIVEETTASVSDSSWHHVVVTYDGTSTAAGVLIYNDTVSQAKTTLQTTLTTTTVDATSKLTFGSSEAGTDDFLAGILDDVRIYDHELAATEVTDLFTARVTVDDSSATIKNTLVNIDVLANDSNTAAPSPTPISHYKLDETSGTTATDSEGSIDGTITGGVTLNQSPSPYDAGGKSMSFDGSTGFIDLGDNFNFDRLDPFTFSFWYNVASSDFHPAISSLGSSGIEIALRFSGELQVALAAGSNGVTVDTTASYPTGGWHQYTITKGSLATAADVSIYLDGVVQTTSTIQDNMTSGTMFDNTDMNIGGRPSNTSRLDGSLDDIRIYDVELSSSQVSDLYDYTVPQITITTIAGDGTASLSADRLSIDYTPDLNFVGEDTFEYDIDASGSPSLVVIDVSGNELAVTEPATDTFFSSVAKLDVTELVNDSFLADGVVTTFGDLISTELGNDTILVTGASSGITGDLLTGAGADTFFSSIAGLKVAELVNDTFFAAELANRLDATEQGNDFFYGSNSEGMNPTEGNDAFSSLVTLFTLVEDILYQNAICILSGDTLPAITIPIERLTTRIKLTGITAGEIIIPNGSVYDSIIKSYFQDNGKFKIQYLDTLTDGSVNTSDSDDYIIDALTSSRGGRNWTIITTGAFTFTQPPEIRSIDLQGVSLLRSNANGSTSIRCRLDRRLSPNDRAIYDSVTYVVDKITQVLQQKLIYMEITTQVS